MRGYEGSFLVLRAPTIQGFSRGLAKKLLLQLVAVAADRIVGQVGDLRVLR